MTPTTRDLLLRGDLDTTVQSLLEDASWWTYKDAQGKSYLLLAIENRIMDAALWLITNGAPVNQSDNDGYTPLMLAVLKKYYAVALALVCKGAALETKDSSGQTALHKAVFVRSEPIIQLLLEAGADPNAEDNDGNLPLDLLFEDQKIAGLMRENHAHLGHELTYRATAA